MVIYDVYWTDKVNMLKVECDCGLNFRWQTNISLITCINCGNMKWWHNDGADYPDMPYFKTAKMNIKKI